MLTLSDRFRGCLVGLATGDALGAPYEGGRIERFAWKLIGKNWKGEIRWTDDTQMALDVAASWLKIGKIDQDDLANEFSQNYRWSRGYGPGTAKTLRRMRRGSHWSRASTSAYRQGSYGNGAAMRAPVIALFCCNQDFGYMVDAVKKASEVTHCNAVAIEGATLVAFFVYAALRRMRLKDAIEGFYEFYPNSRFRDKIDIFQSWIECDVNPPPGDIALSLGNDASAMGSCVTAIYVAEYFKEREFGSMMNCIIACGGDVDTIGAMAGAIWGANNGFSGLASVCLEDERRLIRVAGRILDYVISNS